MKFLGTGEKTDALEVFHPDRLAGRILGMGDVMTLVERAQESYDQAEAAKMEEKLRKGSFTLDDFLDQLQQLQKMGPISQIMGMLPGMGGVAKEAQAAVDRGDLRRVEAIIRSMTPRERRDPDRPQRLAPEADRLRRRDRPDRGQPPGQAIRRDAEADEAVLGIRRTPGRGTCSRDASSGGDGTMNEQDRTDGMPDGTAEPTPTGEPSTPLEPQTTSPIVGAEPASPAPAPIVAPPTEATPARAAQPSTGPAGAPEAVFEPASVAATPTAPVTVGSERRRRAVAG